VRAPPLRKRGGRAGMRQRGRATSHRTNVQKGKKNSSNLSLKLVFGHFQAGRVVRRNRRSLKCRTKLHGGGQNKDPRRWGMWNSRPPDLGSAHWCLRHHRSIDQQQLRSYRNRLRNLHYIYRKCGADQPLFRRHLIDGVVQTDYWYSSMSRNIRLHSDGWIYVATAPSRHACLKLIEMSLYVPSTFLTAEWLSTAERLVGHHLVN
jgi:hypothetical protein